MVTKFWQFMANVLKGNMSVCPHTRKEPLNINYVKLYYNVKTRIFNINMSVMNITYQLDRGC